LGIDTTLNMLVGGGMSEDTVRLDSDEQGIEEAYVFPLLKL